MGGVIIKNSFNDLFEYINDVNDENTLSSPKKPNKNFSLLVNVIAITLLVSGGYGVKMIFDQKRDVEESKVRQQELLASEQRHAAELKEKLEKEKNKVNEFRDFSKLKEENEDTVGWLVVPGAEVDLAVVKAKDNSYYLTHDFDKKYNSMGWIFADYQNSFPDLSTNTIIYGHTYRDSAMFSNLKNVLEDGWFNDKDNHVITFDTEKERLLFDIFSIYTIDKTDDYLYISFNSKDDYKKYLDRELERSIRDFKVDLSTDDKIITLSTCYYDSSKRLVVHGVLKESA